MRRDLLRAIALLIFGGYCLFSAMSGIDTIIEMYLSDGREHGSPLGLTDFLYRPGALKVFGVAIFLLISSVLCLWLSFKKLSGG
jgi:hypothetical protein